jgi:drug/metabolite transporter (DMT)-like permease
MTPTLSGLLAVLFWSSTVAVSRQLSEPLGPLTAGAAAYLLAGLLALGQRSLQPGGLRRLLALPRRYLVGCGALFVAYELLLYLAIGLAATRAQVLAVGLANYLWPSLTLLISLWMFRRKARWFLPAGIALALGGAWLAAAGSGDQDFAVLGSLQDWLPVAMAALAALLWALYSNLSRLWGAGEGSGVPLFLLASGLAFLVLRFRVGETSAWDTALLPALLYMAVFPSWLGYALWERAVQQGDLVLVTIFSYFTPLLSTLISLALLQVPLTPAIALAALLVALGALLSRRGVF